MENVYDPKEDSYLLKEQVEKYVSNLNGKNIRVLDMGSGIGIQAEACLDLGIDNKNILCADINPEAIRVLKDERFNAIFSDLFSNIDEKFDLIIFNPPYLPKNKYDEGLDTTAGKNGNEIILKFLEEAKEHLNEKGIILLLLSNLSKPEVIIGEAKRMDYSIEKLIEQGVGFFEKLGVYKIKREL